METEKTKEGLTLPVDERPCSCKISINAKGVFSIELKNYANTLEEAFEKAKKIAEEAEKYIQNKNNR